MENGLVTKAFNVSTRFFTYQAKFVAPAWAPGYECQMGLCGLCCLTQSPSGVSCAHNANLGKAVCRLYDSDRKMCRQYLQRPTGCKKYPFAIGVEDARILISASLECPGTNSKIDIDTDAVANTLSEQPMDEMIALMNDHYEKAVSSPNIWMDAGQVWSELSRRVQDYFSQKTSLPCLQEVVQLTVDTVWGTVGEESPRIPPCSPATATKNTQGLYIATRFETHPLGLVKVTGSKTNISLFDEKLREIRKTTIKTPTAGFLSLEMDREAQGMIRDYVSFLCNRPFLSLASIRALVENVPVPILLQRTFAGAFAPLEVGATLVAYRDKLKSLDRDAMREIISFSEGNTHSIFAGSGKVHRQ